VRAIRSEFHLRAGAIEDHPEITRWNQQQAVDDSHRPRDYALLCKRRTRQ